MRQHWLLIRSLIAIVIGVLILVSLTFVTINLVCHADIEKWLPIYPKAEVITETHSFIERGAGITTLILSSPDDSTTVTQWYFAHQRSVEQDNPNHGLSTTNFKVQSNSNGLGSVINLYSECAQ